jgi:hypothetical protein
MKVLKRDALGQALEVQLSDNETYLKRWFDHLVGQGERRARAWSMIYNHPATTQTQRTVMERSTFHNWLMGYLNPF